MSPDLSLAHNEQYSFQVRAVNGRGGGPASNTASAQPLAGAPSAPTLSSANGGNARVRLAWSVNPGRWVDHLGVQQ